MIYNQRKKHTVLSKGCGDYVSQITRENGWIVDLNKGDHKAFEAIYRYYYPLLGQMLLRYLQSERAVEDVIHNLFLNIWKNRLNLEPRGTLKAYLYTAARNQAFLYLKKENVHKHENLAIHLHLYIHQVIPEDSIEFKEFKHAMTEAVKQLPERRKQIFLHHREDHMTYKEIAKMLDISIKTVETQISRSLKFLTKKLIHYQG